MARPVEAMPITARRSDAARRMANGADAVLVTRGDRLLGIVTASDLIRSLAAMPRTATPLTVRPRRRHADCSDRPYAALGFCSTTKEYR